MTPRGLVVTQSPVGFVETLDRFKQAVLGRGMSLFATIDHAAAAAAAGMMLRPTTVVIFGSPVAGTPLMQQAQTLGIDLPLRSLIWVDEQERVWLGYNDATWTVTRHTSEHASIPVLVAMSAMLNALIHDVVGAPA